MLLVGDFLWAYPVGRVCNWERDIGHGFWYIGKKINKTWILFLLQLSIARVYVSRCFQTLKRQLHKIRGHKPKSLSNLKIWVLGYSL